MNPKHQPLLHSFPWLTACVNQDFLWIYCLCGFHSRFFSPYYITYLWFTACVNSDPSSTLLLRAAPH